MRITKKGLRRPKLYCCRATSAKHKPDENYNQYQQLAVAQWVTKLDYFWLGIMQQYFGGQHKINSLCCVDCAESSCSPRGVVQMALGARIENLTKTTYKRRGRKSKSSNNCYDDRLPRSPSVRLLINAIAILSLHRTAIVVVDSISREWVGLCC